MCKYVYNWPFPFSDLSNFSYSSKVLIPLLQEINLVIPSNCIKLSNLSLKA